MKSRSFFQIAVLAAAAMAATSTHAQEILVAPTAPPATIYEAVPQARVGYVWDPGHWSWTQERYIWNPGHWQAERMGYHWKQGRWAARHGTWRWVPGHWA
jgi:hypothetical protein